MRKERNGHGAPDWDERYRKGFYDGADDPHDLLVRYAHLFEGRRVADIAMGSGRDALYLASIGIPVTGLERSREGLKLAGEAAAARGFSIEMVRGDAARLPFRSGSFHGALVFYFLLREITRDIAAILDKGGILMYETFLKPGDAANHPRNPAFLLDEGELLALFPGFEPIHYDEGLRSHKGKVRATAQLVARKI
ncbi:MAG: methyltransferase domain-containing protein [Syntrophorhabdaceae bacterium]|nr:methyltransferase domain-containing protein [Syntrophorhabdaceae bacterium]